MTEPLALTFDRPRDLCVEVMVLWGGDVIGLYCIEAGQDFFFGVENSEPLVIGSSGAARVVFGPGASGTVKLSGAETLTVEQVVAAGHARACPECFGSSCLDLVAGTQITLQIEGLKFKILVSPARCGRLATRIKSGFQAGAFGLSALAHWVLLAMAAVAVPELGPDNHQTPQIDEYYVAADLHATAEREADSFRLMPADSKGKNEGEANKCDDLPSADMGIDRVAKRNRWGIAGPKDNADPHVARFYSLTNSRLDPAFGWHASTFSYQAHAPTMPWGRDDSLGNDANDARGHMWGDVIGDGGDDGKGVGGHCDIGCGGGGKVDEPRGGELSRCGSTSERVGSRNFVLVLGDNPCDETPTD